MPLTDTAVRNAKPSEKAVKLSDGGGLQLLVTPAGGKLWRLAYRFGGVQKQLTFGAYPEVTLKAARAKRDAARELLAADIDPAVRARLDRITKANTEANTFSLIAAEFLAKMEREKSAESTLAKTKWLLDFALPDIGSRPITEISAAEVLHVVRKVEARGRFESAPAA